MKRGESEDERARVERARRSRPEDAPCVATVRRRVARRFGGARWCFWTRVCLRFRRAFAMARTPTERRTTERTRNSPRNLRAARSASSARADGGGVDSEFAEDARRRAASVLVDDKARWRSRCSAYPRCRTRTTRGGRWRSRRRWSPRSRRAASPAGAPECHGGRVLRRRGSGNQVRVRRVR